MISFDNIKKVALWDLTFNRSTYRKRLLTIMISLGVLFFIQMVPQLWKAVFYGRDVLQYAYGDMYATDGIFAVLLFILASVIYVLFQGTIFSPLQTKQGRVNEFLLPADNSTRFIWRAFMSLVGTGVAIVLGIVCYDLLLMLLHTIVFKGYEITSVWATLFADEDLSEIPLADSTAFWFFLKTACNLFLLVIASTYVLGGSIKYKFSPLWTTLFHFVLSFLTNVAMVIFAICCASGMLDSVLRYLDENQGIFEWCVNYPWVFSLTACLVEILLIAVMWFYTYRNYCRAQLTSRLNH